MISSLKISLWSKSCAKKLQLEASGASLLPKNFSQGPLEPVQYPKNSSKRPLLLVQYPKTPAKTSGANPVPKISSQGYVGPVWYPKIPVRGL